jgi:hypothetical protein
MRKILTSHEVTPLLTEVKKEMEAILQKAKEKESKG